MQKKRSLRHLMMLISIAVLIAIAGCGSADRDTTSKNWRTGSQGIEMEFQDGAPPRSVYDGDRVDFVLEMWNRGAYPLSGEVYFTGFDPSIFVGIRPIMAVSIPETKTQYNDEGGFTVLRT